MVVFCKIEMLEEMADCEEVPTIDLKFSLTRLVY